MRISDFPIIGEIKDEYKKLRQDGNFRDKAVEKIRNSYANEISCGEESDGLLFKIGLADAQYAIRELSSEVAEEAMAALQEIAQTDWNITPGDIARRREWYAKAPMKERKKVNQVKRFHCNWKIGDTFAFRLLGNEAKEFGLFGRFILFRKVDEAVAPNGAVRPIVTVSMWDDGPLPRTSLEFQRLPILKLDNGRANTRKDQFIYRVEMLIENAGMLEALDLQYLGNFSDVVMPNDEAVIEYVGYMKKLALNRIVINCCQYWSNHHIYESMT